VKVNHVSEENVGSIFRVEEKAMHETSKKTQLFTDTAVRISKPTI
jgi:hypothetical protein